MSNRTSSAFDLDAFGRRHIGTTPADHELMLAELGYDSLDALMAAAVPTSIRMEEVLNSAIPPAATEREALAELAALAEQNTVRTSMIGLGYSGTITPAVIQRNVLENPSWYTAYTPYQPEISQGRLEALINFQTMVSDLTGARHRERVDARRGHRRRRGDAPRPPRARSPRRTGSSSTPTRCRRRTRCSSPAPRPSASSSSWPTSTRTTDVAALGEHFGLFVQYPGASGRVWNPASVIAASKAQGALAVVAADLLAMALLTSPGELGADVAVGTSPALRRAHGLRRTARRLHGRARGPRAAAARPPRRRVAGRVGPSRLPPQPAGARAAHPPREGDVEHLHRPGAARRHGVDVRRVPRAPRHPSHRRGDRREGERARRRAHRLRPHPRERRVLRHDPRARARPRRQRRRARRASSA